MVKQTIQIHCRIKPTKQTVGLYEVGTEDQERDVISFFVPKDIAAGLINNKKEIYKFGFGKIFEQKTSQDEIFEHVAKPVIDSVLCGFNGTIFAYGQTGSGKTFTITGGAERYVDRGIIPRSLSYVFNYFVKNPGFIYTVHISYLEIYNDSGYDLLHPNHEAASKLEDLPKISMLEDYDGNIHLKNLSLNQATNEEEALNLLFLGDTNRMIAETPMNQASTRSHCIFTIHISMREVESATIRRSKLHLVDLAGSERVGKTGVGGTLLKEAKYINLSLHMLEQVIIALSEKSRSHIPYRNSMMTSVLRDSLGGNCMTTMIATCSIEKKNIDESISTCRFAQRVALVKNDALLNEELDPKLVIERLKREIQQLKDELSLVKGVEYSSELTSEEKRMLEEQVDNYLKEMNEEGMLSVGADMRKIKYCFSLFKHQHSSRLHLPPNQSVMSTDEVVPHKKENIDEEGNDDISYLDNQSELKKFKELVVQRDNEINILVKMLKKEKEKNSNNKNGKIHRSSAESTRSLTASIDKSSSTIASPSEEIFARNQSNKAPPKKQLFKSQLSIGRQEAFEIFKRDYPNNKDIEDNKKGLKRRYGDAKKLGEQVNNSRQAINLIKGELEKLKSVRSKENAFIEEEKQLREELDCEKQKYKRCFNQLKLLKTEIEHMQHLLEKTKMKVQKDFEVWWCEQSAMLSNEQEIKEAWKTPPITPMNNNIARPNYEVSQGKIENTIEKSDNRMAATFNRFSTSTPDEQHTHSRRRHSSHKTNSARSNRSLQSTERSENQLAEGEMKSSDKLKQSLTKLRDIRLDQIRTETSKEQVGNQSTGIQLTGDKKTDDDILAFMKAREQLMRKSRLNFP